MTVYRFGPFTLDRGQLLLCLDGTPLPLGPKVVETLLALVEHPGQVLAKSQLLDKIWPEGFVEEANLAQNIYVIRKVLRAHWNASVIETVPRRGYRFMGEVRVESVAPSVPKPQARGRSAAALLVAASLIGILTALPRVAASTHATAVAPALSPGGARLYAMGTYYWNQRTAPSIAKSIRYFNAVVASDPRDARGYAGLACAYAIEGDYSYGGITRKQAWKQATFFAERALALDSQSAPAHAVMGFAAMDGRHMSVAFSEYRRAIAADPRYAPAHQWYGVSLLYAGKTVAAYAELHKAAELDPESVAATDWLSQAAFITRRYNDAISYGRQVLDLSPQRYGAYVTIGMAYEGLGDYRAAISYYRKYAVTCADCHFEAAALLAHAYAILHDSALARAQLEVAQRGMVRRQTSPADVAVALAAMGRKDDALQTLRKGKRDESAALLAADPRMDPLRHDARFREYTQGPG